MIYVGVYDHFIAAVNATEKAQVVQCVHVKGDAFPQSMPEDLASRIMRFHGRPYIWWLGQFLKYMTRPTDEFRADMEDTKQRTGFANPIVG